MSESENIPPSESPEALENDSEVLSPDTSVNKVNEGTCVSCGQTSARICSHCGQEFCAQHFCITHETATTREPVLDEDGTERRGQRVRLIGEGWPNALQLIKDLSDEELDVRIAELQKLKAWAVQTNDYSTISIAAHEFERDYRKHSRYVAAMKRREKLVQGSVKLGSKAHRASAKSSIPADVAALMKLGNLTYEQAVAMKTLLGKAKS